MSIPVHEPFSDDPASDNESDASSEAPPDNSEYRLISSGNDPDVEDDNASGDGERDLPAAHSNGVDLLLLSSPGRPSSSPDRAEAPLSRLDLNGDADLEALARGEEEDTEEEESREREASMARALREDERRRSAPLGQETTARIMDAMRGVTFPGNPPNWTSHVPEEHWLDQIRSLRS